MKLKDFRRKEREARETKECEINYQELFEAAKIFEEDTDAGSDDWILARRFVDWKNLHQLATKDVRYKVIGFLNKWHCRLPGTDKLADKIKETYRQIIPFLKALENESLEDFDFEQKKEVEGKTYSNLEILLRVFGDFCKIGHNFRGVAASKLLSLINPHLFVMWDTGICEAYGIRTPSEPYTRDKQYVPLFFPLMKKKANSVIDSYMKEKKCNRREAIAAINSFREWRPLAKLLDEYNWMKY